MIPIILAKIAHFQTNQSENGFQDQPGHFLIGLKMDFHWSKMDPQHIWTNLSRNDNFWTK